MSNTITEHQFKGLFKPEDEPSWFMALWEAERAVEDNSFKDWAHHFKNGCIGTKDVSIQEWLDDTAEYWEDEGDSFLDTVLAKMSNWGFSE